MYSSNFLLQIHVFTKMVSNHPLYGFLLLKFQKPCEPDCLLLKIAKMPGFRPTLQTRSDLCISRKEAAQPHSQFPYS